MLSAHRRIHCHRRRTVNMTKREMKETKSVEPSTRATHTHTHLDTVNWSLPEILQFWILNLFEVGIFILN